MARLRAYIKGTRGKLWPEGVASAGGVGLQDLTLILCCFPHQTKFASTLGLESTMRQRGRPRKLLEK